jgi:hypothetical protein
VDVIGNAAEGAYPEKIRPSSQVLLITECQFYDACTFRYDGVEMRGNGESFVMRFHTTARPWPPYPPPSQATIP